MLACTSCCSQLATFADHMALARILKPEYPLRRLFRDINLQDQTVPKLSCIAGAVLRASLLGQLHNTVSRMLSTIESSTMGPTIGTMEGQSTPKVNAPEENVQMQPVQESSDVSPQEGQLNLLQYATAVSGSNELNEMQQQSSQVSDGAVASMMGQPDAAAMAEGASQAQVLQGNTATSSPGDAAAGAAATNKDRPYSSWGSSIESLTNSTEEAELESMRAAYMQHAARGTLQRVVRYMRGSKTGSLASMDDAVLTQMPMPTPATSAAAINDTSNDGQKGTCDVCFEAATLVKIKPCSHDMCVQCTTKLLKTLVDKPVLCPFCRRNITGVAGPCMQLA